MASVPITVLLYDGSLLCGFNVAIKGLNECRHHFQPKLRQELSYRKQIARQLRTQFVEGISVTLKSRLRPKGHSKSLETEPLDTSYTTYY